VPAPDRVAFRACPTPCRHEGLAQAEYPSNRRAGRRFVPRSGRQRGRSGPSRRAHGFWLAVFWNKGVGIDHIHARRVIRPDDARHLGSVRESIHQWSQRVRTCVVTGIQDDELPLDWSLHSSFLVLRDANAETFIAQPGSHENGSRAGPLSIDTSVFQAITFICARNRREGHRSLSHISCRKSPGAQFARPSGRQEGRTHRQASRPIPRRKTTTRFATRNDKRRQTSRENIPGSCCLMQPARTASHGGCSLARHLQSNSVPRVDLCAWT
jgi:hypothetical protein